LPRRDIFGEPMQRGETPLLGTAIAQSVLTHDPVAQEMLNLKIFPAPVERRFAVCR